MSAPAEISTVFAELSHSTCQKQPASRNPVKTYVGGVLEALHVATWLLTHALPSPGHMLWAISSV